MSVTECPWCHHELDPNDESIYCEACGKNITRQPPLKFIVEIELGNATMHTHEHIAGALENLAGRLRDGYDEGGVRDEDGNTVGHWSLS